MDSDLAEFILSVRTDLWRIADDNPALWNSGAVPTVTHWWSQLRPYAPSDPAYRYRTPLEYAVRELAYQPPLPVYVPPAESGGTDSDTDEAQQQVDTIASRFKKDWPLIGLGLLGIFLAVRSGIFQR